MRVKTIHNVLLTAIILVIFLSGCASNSLEKQIIGTWEYSDESDVSTDAKSLTFYEGGAVNNSGEDGTWKISKGVLSVKGEWAGMFFSHDTLIGKVQIEGNRMTISDPDVDGNVKNGELIYIRPGSVSADDSGSSVGNNEDGYVSDNDLGSYDVQAKIKLAQVGDTVFFGEYEQDNNTSNGKEKIEWTILAKEDGKALLISKYVLITFDMNSLGYIDLSYALESGEDNTWESMNIRGWLNYDFYYDAFSQTERSLISTTRLKNSDNFKYFELESSLGGNDTEDDIFLLSLDELVKYFGLVSFEGFITSPVCYPTDFGWECFKRNNSEENCKYYEDEWGRACGWYLRSVVTDDYSQSKIYHLRVSQCEPGYVDYVNTNLLDGFRPALWIQY